MRVGCSAGPPRSRPRRRISSTSSRTATTPGSSTRWPAPRPRPSGSARSSPARTSSSTPTAPSPGWTRRSPAARRASWSWFPSSRSGRAVDDGIVDSAGKAAPFVGFSSVEAGKQVGNAIADMYESLGWGEAGPETAIITAEAQTVSVCMDRTENSIAVLKDRLGMTEEQVIHLAVPESQDNAMTTASQAIIAYPNVKRWLIAACNDNGVLGVVRALEQAGYTADDMIGVGVNGQIACEEFKKPQATGFRGSIYVDSAKHGEAAIRQLHDFVTAGTPIPEKTIIAGTLITKDDNEISCGKS
ncbi:MAG: substrate-binding domain-containing protein [Rhizobiales bacterium]|nr:substrate-binding domain-containing protein [Hyphomicrobiales bacterium]